MTRRINVERSETYAKEVDACIEAIQHVGYEVVDIVESVFSLVYPACWRTYSW